MNKRTKWLLAALAVIGVGTLGDQGYRRFIEEPARKRERDVGLIEKRIQEAEDAILASARAADELVLIEEFSLPYDPELARARYKDWLLSLVTKIELQQPSVDGGTPVSVSIKDRNTRKAKEIMKRYTFSLRGRGTLQQVTQLLYEFHQGGHLHKIRSLALVPIADGKLMDLTLAIEALGLNRCEREGELSTVAAHRLAFDKLDAYQTVARRNLFSQEGANALKAVMLTAVAFDRQGRAEAWFSTGGSEPTQVVHRGELLKFPSSRVEVIDIQSQLVLIDVDGHVVGLTLGKTIHEAISVPPTATASDSSAAAPR